MKSGFLDKLIARLGKLSPDEVQNALVRLVQEKGFLEKVFDALQEGVIVTDADGMITYRVQVRNRLPLLLLPPIPTWYRQPADPVGRTRPGCARMASDSSQTLGHPLVACLSSLITSTNARVAPV